MITEVICGNHAARRPWKWWGLRSSWLGPVPRRSENKWRKNCRYVKGTSPLDIAMTSGGLRWHRKESYTNTWHIHTHGRTSEILVGLSWNLIFSWSCFHFVSFGKAESFQKGTIGTKSMWSCTDLCSCKIGVCGKNTHVYMYIVIYCYDRHTWTYKVFHIQFPPLHIFTHLYTSQLPSIFHDFHGLTRWSLRTWTKPRPLRWRKGSRAWPCAATWRRRWTSGGCWPWRRRWDPWRSSWPTPASRAMAAMRRQKLGDHGGPGVWGL